MTIQVQDLHLAYQKDKPIIKGVSFSIKEGESLALLGHNGSGKSTLLKSLISLLPASSGSIEILEKNLPNAKRKDLRSIRTQVGFVFQNHNLVKRLSVLSNVIHGTLGKKNFRCWFQGLAPSAIREQALAKLEQVRLTEFANSRADALSGGQSQRVAIARALMQNPKIILADEPTASLDPKAGKEVMELLQKLCKESGITLIFTTHDLEHAKLYAERALALKNGVVEFDLACSDIDFDNLKDLYEQPTS